MAIVSMTGFGVATVKKKDFEIEVIAKTVNSRFLDIRLHLPREYQIFEPTIKHIVKNAFFRGTVEIYVHRRWLSTARPKKLSFHESVLRDYLKSFQALKTHYGFKSPVQLQDVLAADGVFSLEDQGIEADKEKTALFSVLKKSVKEAKSTRLREGQSLKKDIHQLLGRLQSLVGEITRQARKNRDVRCEKLRSRLQELHIEALDEARISQEIAILLEKSDIQEEFVRFAAHIQYCFDLLQSTPSPGKSLDFYSQELLREINTMGSKVASADIANLVVQTKTTIDRIKEQIANIE